MSDADISVFELYLPLPYRVVFLANLGVLFWYVNLITCRKFNIDVLLVLKLSPLELSLPTLIHHTKQYLIQIFVFNWVSYLIYHFFVSNGWDFYLIDRLPLLCIFFFFYVLLLPSSTSKSYETKRIRETFKRILRGEIDTSIRNNDILLTDTLTSYNKVLIDLFIYLSCLVLGLQALPSGTDLSKSLSKNHLQIYNIDLLLANLPSILRLIQCVKEYKRSNYKNKSHLYNAIKYSTAFLPTTSMILFKSGYVRTLGLWYFAALINSTYSFYWDITNDWNFGVFTKFLNDKPELPVLRGRMIYSKPAYISAILIDLQLRYLWVYRLLYVSANTAETDTTLLTSFFVVLFTTETGNFITEVLEIFRRWVWVFIKIETEYVKIIANNETFELQNLH